LRIDVVEHARRGPGADTLLFPSST
jgi:hypothetical protein